MTRDVDDVQNELMELSPDERLRVAQNLLKSVPEGEGGGPAVLSLAWNAASVDVAIPDAVLAHGNDPIVPVGEVGILAGLGGVGKSRLVAQMAVAAAGAADGELVPVIEHGTGGRDTLRVRGGPVVTVGYEDAAPWVRIRMLDAARWFDDSDKGPCVRVVSDPERLSATVVERPLWGPTTADGRIVGTGPRPLFRQVFDRAAELSASLVIVDPLTLAWNAGVDGYPVEPVNDFVLALRHEAARLTCGVLLVHHMSKLAYGAHRTRMGLDAGHLSGSGAWVDRVRGVLVLAKPAEDDHEDDGADQRIGVVKANYAPSGPDVGWDVESVTDPAGSKRPVAWEAQRGDGELEHEDVKTQGGGVVPITVA